MGENNKDFPLYPAMFNDGEIWSGGGGGKRMHTHRLLLLGSAGIHSFRRSFAAGGSNQFGSHFCHSLDSSGGFQTIQVDPLLYITRASKEYKGKGKKYNVKIYYNQAHTRERTRRYIYKSSFAGADEKVERPADIGSSNSSAIISCCCWRNVQFHLFH